MTNDLSRVANDFILKAHEENLYLPPTKLLKLVYFMYGHYMQKTGEQLFPEHYQAWDYGPVVPELYNRIHGKSAIDQLIANDEGKLYVTNHNSEYGKDYYEVFDYVWKKYRVYSANNLSSLTHANNSPWEVTRRLKGKNCEIDSELIRRYFKGENIANG